ncbi:hypothetical protein [Dechloromonas sp. ZS-1]|uniref:hypothetical protein n=1 Tax=Dechloromonas sp. ZS-1 TaxID=3138067 RepID=UPI0031FCCC85
MKIKFFGFVGILGVWVGAQAGVSVDSNGFVESVNSTVKMGESLKAQRDYEAEVARRDRRAKSEGAMGGQLSCTSVVKDHALYDYCNTGNCSGFSSNYGLYSLCDGNKTDGLGDHGMVRYIENGDIAVFSKNIKYYQAAQKQSGSFIDRKRFVIYYLRGYVYH